MIIRPIDRKKRFFGTYEFTTFKEVFDYCLDVLEKTDCRHDDIMFLFMILDTGERFYLRGGSKNNEYVLNEEIIFLWRHQ